MGRSTIALSGDDIVLRAKNSVDVTATDNDVRIKAERNLDLVGGVSGRGRTLVENQATGRPINQDVYSLEGEAINGRGVVLKADTSMVAAYGRDVYLRSLERGTILLDASEGEGSIRAASRVTRLLSKSGTEIGIGEPGQVTGLLSMGSSSIAIQGSMEIHGGVLIKEYCLADRGCNMMEMENFTRPIRETGETRPQLMDERIERFDEGTGKWLEEYYWAENQTGHKDTINNYMFSYRTPDQCGASRYSFEEPYWMELYGEQACASLATWNEPVYVYQDVTNQQPWPGYSAWSEEESLKKADLLYYDSAQGVDLAAAKETTEEPEKVIPGEYLRIVDPI